MVTLAEIAELKRRLANLAPKQMSETQVDSSVIVFAMLEYLFQSWATAPYGISQDKWEEIGKPRVQEYLLLFLTRFESATKNFSPEEIITYLPHLGIQEALDNTLNSSLKQELITATATVTPDSSIEEIEEKAVNNTFNAYLNNVILPQAFFEYLLHSHFYELEAESPVRRDKIDAALRSMISGDTNSLLSQNIAELSKAFSDNFKDIKKYSHQYMKNIADIVLQMNNEMGALIRIGTAGGNDKSFAQILQHRVTTAQQHYLEKNNEERHLRKLAKELATKTLPEKALEDALNKSLTEKGKVKYSDKNAFKKGNVIECLQEIRSALRDQQGLFDQQKLLNKILSNYLTRRLVLPENITSVLPSVRSEPLSVESLQNVFARAVEEYKKRTRFDKHNTFLGIAYWSLHHGAEGQRRVEELATKINSSKSADDVTVILIEHFLHGAGGSRYKSFKPILDEFLSKDPATTEYWKAIKDIFIAKKVEPIFSSSVGSYAPDTASELSDSSSASRPPYLRRTASDGSDGSDKSSQSAQGKVGKVFPEQYRNAICAHLDRQLGSASARPSSPSTTR